MRAGQLNRRIVIQTATLTADGSGGTSTAWGTFATVWAAVWPVSGRERIANQRTEADITVRVRIRYLDGVKEAMRIALGSQTFEITAVINFEARNVYQDLLCREIK